MSNPQAISEDSTKKIKEDILTLEVELENAEKTLELALLRVKTLTSALEEKRASIAPIKLASFDILLLVFEWCSIADWTSPLRIGGVCRSWRSIIFNTPRAWMFIDMLYLDGHICDTYLNQSKHCGLHVVTDEIGDMKAADKNQCLTMIEDPRNTDMPFFSQLGRFCYADGPSIVGDLKILSPFHFPLLRHLEIHCVMAATTGLLELPPLETLVITIYDNYGWPAIMQVCKSSLISLKMTVYDCSDLGPIHIELANLVYLEIINHAQFELRGSLDLTTPILKTYIEDNAMSKYPYVRCHIPKSITHMRLGHFPLAAGLAQLRVLQVDLNYTQALEFLEDIKVDGRAYPSLQTLEFRRPGKGNAHMMETADEIVNAADWSTFIHSVNPPMVVDVWSMQLPGENGHLCGNDAPCAKWTGV